MPIQRARHWKICADPADEGVQANWQGRVAHDAVPAPVPGIIQQVLPDHHGVAWYWCELTPLPVPPHHRALLHFESVDYAATVWMNGRVIGAHEGDGAPFELDVTGYVDQDRANLVAVRVINPTAEPIDGMILSEVPHSNKVLPADFRPGWSFNFGGILGDVVLHVEPETRFLDVVVRSQLSTGTITVDAVLSAAVVDGSPMAVSVLVSEERSGLHVVTERRPVDFGRPSDESPVVRLELQLPPDEVIPWDIDDPFLYAVRVRLEPAGGGAAEDERTVRTGFRQLSVRDGWFVLNGRRIYLRSTHTGNHYPIGQVVPQDPSLVRKDLVYAKAAGFNTVRFIAGMAREDQLSFCDELGLMVYEETRASWLLGDSPRMGEHFDRSYDEMIRRDRNHPSVVIWGLLNETYDGPVFRHAVDYLARLRQLDDTRLVILSSGRWDGDLAVGSVCNPGETTWRHEWGDEREGAAHVEVGWAHDRDRGGYVPGAGDLHLYPALPESPAAERLLRTIGSAEKRVFLSEYGVGSLFDAVTALAEASCHLVSSSTPGSRPLEPPDVGYTRAMAERFISDWNRFEMDGVYCFPEDAFAESQLNQSRHRATNFDSIRANGNIAGYNLTGMLDHALTGEGSWTFGRRWKPSAMDTIAEGWSPLRWCLGLTPAVVFPGDEVTLDLALASEDVLPPGRYTARVAIVGPGGWRWERSADLPLEPGWGPLSVPVLTDRVALDGPPGDYRCAASLGLAASPAAGRTTVAVLPRPADLTPRRRAAALGLTEPELGWVGAHGLDAIPWADTLTSVDFFLVGHTSAVTDEDWRSLAAALDRGATALLLCPWELIAPGETSASIPLGATITCTGFHDWLYHKECFSRAEIVDGLPGPGLMNWRQYGPVLPRHLIEGEADHVAAFAIAVGYPCAGGYASGLLAARFRHGRGRLVISTFNLLSSLGQLAVADCLLLNLLRYASS